MAGELSVVLVSGGMDSCVTAAIAVASGEAAFLHISYGQRTEAKERRCFEDLAGHFRVNRRLHARLDHLRAIGGSSLTDASREIPAADLSRREIPPTYVPFRNGQLLAIAASWAEVIGAGRIYIGAVEEDSSGYPDCRRAFFDRFQEAIAAGTKPGRPVSIETPVIGLRKKEIVETGTRLGAPFHLTWSCYRDEEMACGDCDSCALRLRAFAEAGRADPIPYRAAGR